MQIDTRDCGSVSLSGPGAGGSPTAVVLLADLVRGARRIALQPPTATVTASSADDQVERWALSVVRREGVGARLRQELSRGGIRAERLEVNSGRAIVPTVLDPAPCSRVALLEEGPGAEGLGPVMTRYAMDREAVRSRG